MQDDSHERKKQIAESWGDSRHGSFCERSTQSQLELGADPQSLGQQKLQR